MELFSLAFFFNFIFYFLGGKGCHLDLEKYGMDITLIKCNGSPGAPANSGEIPSSGA